MSVPWFRLPRIRFRNEKGQVEAPFQLLIAAVMLGMLLPIAFYLFQQYQVWESQQRVRNNMETLAREIEMTASLGEGTKYIDVDLNVYGGPQFRVDNFTLERPTDDTCQLACHTPHCLLLKAVYASETGSEIVPSGLPPVCVRVPFNVEFTTQCGELESGYGDGPQKFAPGFYRFIAVKKGYRVYFCTPKETGV